MNPLTHLEDLRAYLESHYAAQTADTYYRSIVKFINRYPNAHQLNLSDVETYFLYLKNQNHAVGYRTVALAGIKAFYQYLLDKSIITEHICNAYFISERRPTGKNFNALLSLDEMETLFTLRNERYSFLANRNKVIIGLLIYQGLTSAELVNLKTHHVDLENGRVTIMASGKNRKRTLELKPKQVPFLIRYVEQDRPIQIKTQTDKLLVTKLGKPMTIDGLHGFISSMQGAFDKELSPKNIRNSVISHWLNTRKLPLEDVQIMAGHSYPSTTERHIKIDMDSQREAINDLHRTVFEG